MITDLVVPLAPMREPLSPVRAARRGELIQSLCEPVVVPEDAYSLEYWNQGTFSAFKPRNAWEDWLSQQASVMMFRISRSERIERRLRDLQSLRAIDCWDDDRRVAVEETATKLAEDPGRTYAMLLSTPAGCDWLIERWEGLADIPAERWTEAQRLFVRLVCPLKAREYQEPGFVARRIASLRELRERNRDSDRALRALVEADVSDEVSPALARLRRYRASLQRQLKWYVDQLRVEPPEHRLDYRYSPEYERRMVEPYPPVAPEAATPANPIASETKPTAAPDDAIDETNPPARMADNAPASADETKPSERADAPTPSPQIISGKEVANEIVQPMAGVIERRLIDLAQPGDRHSEAKRRSA